MDKFLHSRFFRFLVCFVLVCAILINCSPIRAEATGIPAIDVPGFAILLAMLTPVYVFLIVFALLCLSWFLIFRYYFKWDLSPSGVVAVKSDLSSNRSFSVITNHTIDISKKLHKNTPNTGNPVSGDTY